MWLALDRRLLSLQQRLELYEPRPTEPSLASCSPRSNTLRVASGDGLRPYLTATARDTYATSGRDEETACFCQTKKHYWQEDKLHLQNVVVAAKKDIAIP